MNYNLISDSKFYSINNFFFNYNNFCLMVLINYYIQLIKYKLVKFQSWFALPYIK